MKATYNSHIIEAIKGEDNLYRATIDGKPANLEPSHYRGVVIRQAKNWLQEQERQETQLKHVQLLKEIGL